VISVAAQASAVAKASVEGPVSVVEEMVSVAGLVSVEDSASVVAGSVSVAGSAAVEDSVAVVEDWASAADSAAAVGSASVVALAVVEDWASSQKVDLDSVWQSVESVSAGVADRQVCDLVPRADDSPEVLPGWEADSSAGDSANYRHIQDGCYTELAADDTRHVVDGKDFSIQPKRCDCSSTGAMSNSIPTPSIPRAGCSCTKLQAGSADPSSQPPHSSEAARIPQPGCRPAHKPLAGSRAVSRRPAGQPTVAPPLAVAGCSASFPQHRPGYAVAGSTRSLLPDQLKTLALWTRNHPRFPPSC
jgi:hypothetical protein